jgi:cytochrome c5
MSEQKDRIFYRNYITILGLLTLMVVIFIILSSVFGDREKAYMAEREPLVKEITAPIGKVAVADQGQAVKTPAQTAGAGTPATAAAGATDSENAGKKVFDGLCFSCHGTGLPGIPQFGDAKAWAPRIAKGTNVLYDHALHGFTGTSGTMMPAKGGNPALSDDQVKAAVNYMIANSK